MTVSDVVGMDQRLRHGDESLNNPLGNNDEEGQEWQDFLVETRPNQEEMYSRKQIAGQRKGLLMGALAKLDDRERAIFVARHLTDSDSIPTLEELSGQFGVSRERIRQLEERAYKKVQAALSTARPETIH